MALTQQALEQYYKLAQEQGAALRIEGDVVTLIPQQPAKSPEPQQEKKDHKGRKLPKVLTPQQVEKFMAGFNKEHYSGTGRRDITDLRDHVMCRVMWKAGLRIAEVCNLAPADVDLEKGRIYVQLGKGAADRMVPIGECLIEWLRKWEAVRPQSEDFYFCTLKGGIVADRHLKQRIKDVSEATGVYIQNGREKKTVHAHNFRHTFATDLLSKGVNIRKIQTLMGHKNVTTTEIYAAVNMDELDREIKALG